MTNRVLCNLNTHSTQIPDRSPTQIFVWIVLGHENGLYYFTNSHYICTYSLSNTKIAFGEEMKFMWVHIVALLHWKMVNLLKLTLVLSAPNWFRWKLSRWIFHHKTQSLEKYSCPLFAHVLSDKTFDRVWKTRRL